MSDHTFSELKDLKVMIWKYMDLNDLNDGQMYFTIVYIYVGFKKENLIVMYLDFFSEAP